MEMHKDNSEINYSVLSPVPVSKDLHQDAERWKEEGERKSCITMLRKLFRDPTFWIFVSAIVGAGLGILLSHYHASEELVDWVALAGDLFLRSLKCVVLPLVFVNIVLSVIEMMKLGKAASIGWKTLAMYSSTTVFAAAEGLVSVLVFKQWFTVSNGPAAMDPTSLVQLQCGDQMYLTRHDDGSMFCEPWSADANASQTFTFHDVNDRFQMTGGIATDVSVSRTIQDGIFRKAVPENITQEFYAANFVGVIVFAIVFAVATQMKPQHAAEAFTNKCTTIISFMHELNHVFLVLINAVISFTPFAVISLIAGALGKNQDLGHVLHNIALLVACFMTTITFHMFVSYPLMYVLTVRKNPFQYMTSLGPAQIFGFASSCSAATLPVTTQCVESTGEVPHNVGQFVLALGSSINMDGGAIYFPTAIVFLAVSSGLEDKLNAASYFLIILLSTLGSLGTAPVPSASLVLIITAFNTVFDATGTPKNFEYILAIDWLMDRVRTVANITGDAVMARVIVAIANASELDGAPTDINDLEDQPL